MATIHEIIIATLDLNVLSFVAGNWTMSIEGEDFLPPEEKLIISNPEDIDEDAMHRDRDG